MKMADARPCSGCADVKRERRWLTTNSRPKKPFELWPSYSPEDPTAPPTRGRRKYVLEYLDGEPVFRLVEMPSKPVLPRDEIEVALDEVMVELFGPDPDGNEIVPQKLAKLFPTRSNR